MELSTGISLIAILISCFTLYNNFLKRAAITIHLGDSLDIVIHTHSNFNSIQLACVFANSGSQLGAVNKLALKIHTPSEETHILNWNYFVKHKEGHKAYAEENARTIPVLGKSVAFQRIQFRGNTFAWVPGNYKIELLGWESTDCTSRNNLLSSQHFSLSLNESQGLSIKPQDPLLLNIVFSGYQLPTPQSQNPS